jgi:mannan endo-1,4-beta-mannosidase
VRPRLLTGVTVATVAAPALLAGSLRLMHDTQPVPQPPAHARAARVILAPPGGLVLGVRERGTPRAWLTVQRFAGEVGRTPSLVLLYTRPGLPFPAQFARTAARHGAALIIQVNPGAFRLRAIAHGAIDSWLTRYARQVAASRRPVVIGFAHEANGRWYPWGWHHQSPAAFVAAWRHVVTEFRRAGARNVTWLWTLSSSRHTAPARRYWPGAKYVTWAGIDGYYYTRRETFGQVYGHAISQVRSLTTAPILLSEVGIGQVAGQARKLPGLFAGIRHRGLLGLVWYDVAQHDGLYHQDWRLEGHPAAVAAFRRGMRSAAGVGAGG